MRAESVLLTKGNYFFLLDYGPKEPRICTIQESTICMPLFLSAFFFFFSNPIKKEGRRAKHSGILWQNMSHRLLTQLGLEKQPWDVLIPGLCSRGHMLQAEIMKWQGVTPCNISLCCAMTAEGSMPVCDDSKGWNRSPREALEFPAQGWGRDKRVRVSLACWSRLWFGEDATSFLEVPSRPHFLKLNLKPCNMTLWEQMRSSPQCQHVLNCSFKAAPISQLPSTAASSQCASSHNPDLGPVPLWCIPCCIFLPEICPIIWYLHFYLGNFSEAGIFVILKFLRNEINKEILKTLYFQGSGDKLPYTKGLPSPASLLIPKPKHGGSRDPWSTSDCLIASL